MSSDRVRRRVAWEAARLMYTREESEYAPAKRKAARRVVSGPPRRGDLPSKREIRSELERLLESGDETLAACAEPLDGRGKLDRFHVYQMLLAPLEQVKENANSHPEGDVLYHSLQVFALRATSCLTMRSSCWPRCCTTWERASIERTTWRPRWKRFPGR